MPVDDHHIDRPAGALALVKLARDREMVGHIVVVVQDLVEFALGAAIIGIGAGFFALQLLVDAAQDQGRFAIIPHCTKGAERNGMVDLGGAVAGLDVGQIEHPAFAVSVPDWPERRIGNDAIHASLDREAGIGRVSRNRLETLRAEVSCASTVDFIRQHLIRIGRQEQRTVARRRLVDARVLGDVGEPVSHIGERDRSGICLIPHRG